MEYSAYLSSLYEEEDFEMNERLLIKKLIFLLIALSLGDGVEDYKSIKLL